MADHAPSGTEYPQNRNELNQAEPIFLEEEAVSEEAEEEEEEEEEEEADEEYTSHLESIIELYSGGDEEDEDEACSLADEGSEGNRWSDTQIDGLFCPICMEAWTNNGDHHICCLPCGHIYGMSCIQKWLQQCQNQAKCPQCNRRCKMKDVRKLFASRVVAIDDEAQKRIQSLENKCASLEKKRAGWTKKEAKWRKIEAELQVGVQQLRVNLAKLVQQSSEYEQQMVQKLTDMSNGQSRGSMKSSRKWPSTSNRTSSGSLNMSRNWQDISGRKSSWLNVSDRQNRSWLNASRDWPSMMTGLKSCLKFSGHTPLISQRFPDLRRKMSRRRHSMMTH